MISSFFQGVLGRDSTSLQKKITVNAGNNGYLGKTKMFLKFFVKNGFHFFLNTRSFSSKQEKMSITAAKTRQYSLKKMFFLVKVLLRDNDTV